MKWFKIMLCVLLTVAHWLTEAGSILWLKYKPTVIYIDPWLSPNYEFPSAEGTPKGKVSLFWYLNYLSVDFLFCVTFFVMAKVASKYSWQLFLVSSVFFFYHVFDLGMFLWNFKSSYPAYGIVHVACFLALVAILIPEKKQAVIKSLK